MHTTETATAQELINIAVNIAARQAAEGANDTAWCRRYPGLGSTKTYKLIQRGDISGLDTARWLLDYRAVAALLDTLDGGEQAEPLYDDLTPVLALKAALAGAMRESSNRRLIILLGEPGTGKTSAARLAGDRYGVRVVRAEADETWKDSAGAMLSGLLRTLGAGEIPPAHADRLANLITRLRQSRTALVIDEAHHLGPRTLNLVKTLINQTPGEFVFLCLPTLWRRLETTAYDECRQLTTNRLFERIALDGVSRQDAARLIERRIPGINGAAIQAAELTRHDARKRGGLAWVAAVCAQAQRLAADTPCDLDTYSRALSRTAAQRGINA